MSWEDEDFEVDLNDRRRFAKPGFSDEEDEDGAVKDAWDADSDDEKKAEAATAEKSAAAAPTKPKKKSIKQIAAEKEAKTLAEAEARRKVHDGARDPDELDDPDAEKARRQRLVEESDMENAKDLFGAAASKEAAPSVGIDAMHPKSRAEFETFAKAVSTKLCQFESAPLYTHCLETILKEAVAAMHFEDIRKLSGSLNIIANTKQQADKAKKGAGAKKKKAGGMLAKMGKDDAGDEIDAYDGVQGGGRYNDTFDDFM